MNSKPLSLESLQEALCGIVAKENRVTHDLILPTWVINALRRDGVIDESGEVIDHKKWAEWLHDGWIESERGA